MIRLPAYLRGLPGLAIAALILALAISASTPSPSTQPERQSNG